MHVINRSLGGGYYGPGDGTSWFSNSTLNNIDTAVSGGIVFVNSTGNYAEGTWYGRFDDYDGDDVLNFASRDERNSFNLREGRSVIVYLRWDDTWGGADCDLDLRLRRFLPGPGNDFTVVRDTATQDGDDNDIPYAQFSFRAESQDEEGTYYFVIDRHTCADEPAWIQLRTWGVTLQYYSLWHSINGPSESRNPGYAGSGRRALGQSPGYRLLQQPGPHH